ncbi:serine hydrolase [Actinokineospora sp. NBRC 105648]|uniref:serine hydrolase n=1 Tax=Actinokineospora sp. NBRC 105648 TaxID=3032206 RepID=UPI0024A58396|nr:serine hydrolase [Actinokineospora sp. NBRC 105648]GLZ40147.1 serine hydrolase [Actinokineospora sp. NBRC 105648]
MTLTRRTAIGLGAAATIAAATATPAAAAPAAATPEHTIRHAYRKQTRKAGGTWQALITQPAGTIVEEHADDLVEAYSVNKIAVATAVLDKIDRGLLTRTHRVELTQDIVSPTGDGIIPLDGAYPSSFTLGHVLALLLTVSDDTAVRLCGLVCPAKELNEILVAKGFPNTQVVPVANPNRFYLGKTTPRETHRLLNSLAAGTLLSPTSSAYLLKILRSQAAFTDGIRRDMSSAERSQVATKAGWFNDGRNEAGLVFDAADQPVLTYALFCQGAGDPNDFGGTHPAVVARANLGRTILDTLAPTTAMARVAPGYQPSNGG